MQRQVFPLSIALSLCLLVLLIGLITVWEPRSIAATQDKPAAAEISVGATGDGARTGTFPLRRVKDQIQYAVSGRRRRITKVGGVWQNDGKLLQSTHADIHLAHPVCRPTEDVMRNRVEVSRTSDIGARMRIHDQARSGCPCYSVLASNIAFSHDIRGAGAFNSVPSHFY